MSDDDSNDKTQEIRERVGDDGALGADTDSGDGTVLTLDGDSDTPDSEGESTGEDGESDTK
jgi:hypothetical protein